jgi:hypothetical protein
MNSCILESVFNAVIFYKLYEYASRHMLKFNIYLQKYLI